MSPEMIEAARLLMAHPKCPEGLVLHTVRRGRPVVRCGNCPETWRIGAEESVNGCPKCGAGLQSARIIYPADDVTPDLASAANGGVLLVALEGGWTTTSPAHGDDMWALERWRDCFVVESKHFAHAAALAFLAVR